MLNTNSNGLDNVLECSHLKLNVFNYKKYNFSSLQLCNIIIWTFIPSDSHKNWIKTIKTTEFNVKEEWLMIEP